MLGSHPCDRTPATPREPPELGPLDSIKNPCASHRGTPPRASIQRTTTRGWSPWQRGIVEQRDRVNVIVVSEQFEIRIISLSYQPANVVGIIVGDKVGRIGPMFPATVRGIRTATTRNQSNIVLESLDPTDEIKPDIVRIQEIRLGSPMEVHALGWLRSHQLHELRERYIPAVAERFHSLQWESRRIADQIKVGRKESRIGIPDKRYDEAVAFPRG